MRAANTSLTWRDVKLILAGSARKNDTSNTGWEQGALEYGSSTQRYDFNHEYGFGVVDAGAAETLADSWTNLPAYIEVTAEWEGIAVAIPDLPSSGTAVPLERTVVVGPDVEFTEFVEINVEFVAVPSANDVRRFRELEIELESPSGATSILAPAIDDIVICVFDDPCGLEGGFRFGSAKHLGEDPEGEWKLRITDRKTGSTPGTLESWSLTIYGHRSTPAAPVIDSVGAGSESLTVTWTAPGIVGASDVTAYDLRYIETSADETVDGNWTTVDDIWTSTGGGYLEYTRNGLSGSTQYDVQVRAVNTEGDGLWSETETGTPTTDKAPDIDSVSPGDRSITVEWTAPTNATLGTITSYDLRYIRSDASDKADTNWTTVSSIWSSGTLEYTLGPPVNPLTNGVSYDVQVRAVVGDDQQPWSGVRSAQPRTKPGSPTIDLVTEDDRSLTVRWRTPTNSGGATVTSYDLRYIETIADETADDNWTVERDLGTLGELVHSATVANLQNGTQYDLQVRAVNAAGEGGWSAASVGTPRTVPDAPAIDSVSGATKRLNVEWSAPINDGGAAPTSYDLRYIEASADGTMEANWSIKVAAWTSGGLEAAITGLEVGTRYRVQVRAVNEAGEGSWSPTRTGMTALAASAANLSSLALTGATLYPSFAVDTTSYRASTGYLGTQITISATPSRADSTVEFLDGDSQPLTGTDSADGFQANLSVGENVVMIRVTAIDNVTIKTYTVTIGRAGEDRSLTPPAADPVAGFSSSAVYTVTFQGRWTTAVAPGGLPGGSHFSPLIGAVHSAGVTFLKSGELASSGVESMAEVGGTAAFREEINDEINATPPTALSVLSRSGNIGRQGQATLNNVVVTEEHPRVTLTTMIAPSHDWFVGVSGLLLLDPQGNWLDTHEVDLYPWDAGTEEGTDFSLSPSVDTDPREVVHSIRGEEKFSTERIASLSFTRRSLSPYFPSTESGWRSVAENTGAGQPIGSPVAATDPDNHGLTYELAGPDAGSFRIVSSTGQLQTRTALDYEEKSSYSVTVKVRDTFGLTSGIAVTVTVADVNEAPRFPPGETGARSVLENVAQGTDVGAPVGAVDGDNEPLTYTLGGSDAESFRIAASTGQLRTRVDLNHEEKSRYSVKVLVRDGRDADGNPDTADDDSIDVTITVADVNEAPQFPPEETGTRSVPENSGTGVNIGAPVRADDPESNALTYVLNGPDAGSFRIVSSSGQLQTRASLDHEDRSSYSVTVSVRDGKDGNGNPDTQTDDSISVTIAVANEEEAGTLSLSPSQPQAGTPITATLSDPDGVLSAVDWTWEISSNRSIWSSIGGATSESYTPSDSDVGSYLRVTASYTGGHGSDKEAQQESGFRVQAAPATNQPPQFPTSESGQRSVAENTREARNIGAPVAANYLDNDTLTYHLSGADADSFHIVSSTGQLQTLAALDHEERSSYSVMVTAIDPSNESDAITVTISVADVNEAPEFSQTETGVRSVPEGTDAGEDIGAPVGAEDEENDSLAYGLFGGHAGSFAIDPGTGQLSTATVLDHEGRASYSVTVTVADGRDAQGNVDSGTDNSIAITIIVANEEEDGTLTLSPAEPRVDSALTANLSDPDGGISNVTWKWERSRDGNSWSDIAGAVSRSYMPLTGDLGYFLQVTASYTDGHGPDKRARAASAHPVAAAPPRGGGPAPPPPPPPPSPPPPPRVVCAYDLGTVAATASRNGSWESGCNSEARSGSHARYYSFTLATEMEATIELSSSAADPYLYLREGSATSGTALHENNDVADGNTDSQIVAILAAGSYTIEATTFSAGATGGFTLSVSVAEPPAVSCIQDLGALTTGETKTLTGSWVEDCDSAYREGSYARFYSFTLGEEREVTIDLTSSVDTYLYLLEGTGEEGEVITENDDAAEGGTDSRIVATLSSGTYAIEAATSGAGVTGDFTLDVTASEPPAGNCIQDLDALATGETATLTGAWADDCDSGNREGSYARYYSFNLTQDMEVTVDLTSTEGTYLYLLEGEGEGGAVEAENGDSDSRIVATVSAGTYTIEAATASAGVTGDFTLGVSLTQPPPSDSCATALGTLTRGATKSGTWADGCDSANREGSRAWYYTFTLAQETEVTIGLTSTEDTYLYLLVGAGRDGTVEEENDDIESGNTDSRIVATLTAGTYTIEATTYAEDTTGSFTLSVSRVGGTGTPSATGCSPATLTLPASEVAGTWADDCESGVSGRGYARHYSFTLSEETQVAIDLTSSVDTYLYLREGSATSGTALHDNDDIESGNTDSRIVATLTAGTYTIEATTYNTATAGSFTLSVSGGGEAQTPVTTGCSPVALTLPASGVAGSWADDCESEVSGRGYARYYSFTLTESAEATIDLTSSVDTYLYLRGGSATSGTAAHSNDDIESGNTDSQIVADLDTGTYTIEATTYSEGTVGSFTLSVSGGGQTQATTGCDPASLTLPTAGVSGSWSDDCESEVSDRGYARYYSFTLDAETDVTIDLSSDVDTYLYLREGSAISGTALHNNDDIESGNTDSRIVATLAAGTYTVEATTHNEDTTGSFTLSVSEGGGTGTPAAAGCTPAELALPVSGGSGSWADGCQSGVSGRGYALYYSFTLAEETEVTIDLSSSVDTYLYLREGSATSGTALHYNDDIESGDTDSRIVATLAAGTYTIEATTYAEATTGSFALSVSKGGSG